MGGDSDLHVFNILGLSPHRHTEKSLADFVSTFNGNAMFVKGVDIFSINVDIHKDVMLVFRRLQIRIVSVLFLVFTYLHVHFSICI